ncbi:hypothetical protein [Neisseria sp. 83E34]|uniref:hypothetical protein n=1 Tax=Neisseria sp. 83E34 TaxID=1692264 RepID=UPI000A8DBBD6|nr:hypothetical protein [Neisseria sp. 83E34]
MPALRVSDRHCWLLCLIATALGLLVGGQGCPPYGFSDRHFNPPACRHTRA